jgi:hypothetical protein
MPSPLPWHPASAVEKGASHRIPASCTTPGCLRDNARSQDQQQTPQPLPWSQTTLAVFRWIVGNGSLNSSRDSHFPQQLFVIVGQQQTSPIPTRGTHKRVSVARRFSALRANGNSLDRRAARLVAQSTARTFNRRAHSMPSFAALRCAACSRPCRSCRRYVSISSESLI